MNEPRDPVLHLYALFHLNLAYSSIEEDQRPEVVRKCYWPLLRLARDLDLPLGIEASAFTLETVAEIDPAWVEELRHLAGKGRCELVGSGYAQVIGPLVPPEVNAANLSLGNDGYVKLLGVRPQIALVNEQAYSAGLIEHYLSAGYRAIVVEWDNPARCHPQWKPEWRYLPQLACDQSGEAIPLIWSKSIAFQKFQRYAHSEMEFDEYLAYLGGHVSGAPRAFPLYSGDLEIFDFRPGRYATEPVQREESEWLRLGRVFEALRDDGRFRFVRPRDVLELMDLAGAGNALHLESPEQPVPVKKQGKYNITRWAVTGRDDIGINTACWNIYKALRGRADASDDDWRELCYLWSSDFRTHITERRWTAYRRRLHAFQERLAAQPKAWPIGKASIGGPARLERTGALLSITSEATAVRLSCRRGLALDALRFGAESPNLCGTLHHGYYDDISLGADFYTGHLVLEAPGQHKITDLEPVSPSVERDGGVTIVRAEIATALGPLRKTVRVHGDSPRLDVEYELDWPSVPIGSLRLGYVTLDPATFDYGTLYYRTHNGGHRPETFPLAGRVVDHGSPVSFLVSAAQGIGVTSGFVDLGDAQRCLRVVVDKSLAAAIGFITSRPVGDTYFCRLAFSIGEVDETRRANTDPARPLRLRMSITNSEPLSAPSGS